MARKSSLHRKKTDRVRESSIIKSATSSHFCLGNSHLQCSLLGGLKPIESFLFIINDSKCLPGAHLRHRGYVRHSITTGRGPKRLPTPVLGARNSWSGAIFFTHVYHSLYWCALRPMPEGMRASSLRQDQRTIGEVPPVGAIEGRFGISIFSLSLSARGYNSEAVPRTLLCIRRSPNQTRVRLFYNGMRQAPTRWTFVLVVGFTRSESRKEPIISRQRG